MPRSLRFVDYALKVGQKPALLIECKRWNESLEKQKHENQIFRYAYNEGVLIVVLTNGKKMEILPRVG